MKNFRLFRQAENDLESIWKYSAENWGVEQANAYIDGLVDIFKLLFENPLMCRQREEFIPPLYTHQHGHYLIVFIPSENGIDIVRVLHESMDIDSQFDE